MRREHALALAARHFDGGGFARDLARRVALRTESQDPASGPALHACLTDEICRPRGDLAGQSRWMLRSLGARQRGRSESRPAGATGP